MAHGRSNEQTKVSLRKKRLERAGLMNQAQIWFGRVLVFALTVLVLIWLGKQAYVFCVAQAIRTERAQWTVLASDYDGDATIMRNETVVTTPVAGNIARLVPEGTRVHIGSAVAQVDAPMSPEKNQGPVELQSPVAGAVCYHLDGWEGILTPANYQRMDLFALFASVKKNHPGDLSQVVKSGDPVYKVIDNLVNPYFVVELDRQPQDLAIGNRVDLSWDSGGQGKGTIIGLHSKTGAYIVVMEVSQAGQDFATGRTLHVTVINKKCEGIVLPVEALVTKNGKRGVYTRTPIGFKFNSVQVLGTLGNRVAIQGIQPDTDVVVNPGLLKRINQEI